MVMPAYHEPKKEAPVLNSRIMENLPRNDDSRVVRFGVFEVDLEAGELRRNGMRVRLQEQPFQVLRTLLEHHDEVVTRDELQATLWPSDTFVDFDHSLNAAVKRLRDALGDTAENPRFVETLARKGYRFIAPLNGKTEHALPPVAVPAPAPVPGDHWWIAGAVIAAVVLLLAGLFLGLRLARQAQVTTHITERRLTFNPEEHRVYGGVLSPDGKNLAFADDTGFYLRQVDTGETHPVSFPPEFNPRPKPMAWFPDGTHILACWASSAAEPTSLWVISIMGGTPRKLIDNAWQAALSSDGSQILFVRGTGKGFQEVWAMRSTGEDAHMILGGPGDIFGYAVWSPDGKRIAYVRAVYRPGEASSDAWLTVMDLASRQTHEVLEQPRLTGNLAWAPDGRLIYGMVETPPNQGDSNLWAGRLDERTGKLIGSVRLTNSPDQVAGTAGISADGNRMSILKSGWQPDVYIAKIEGNHFSTPRRFTLDERRDFPYTWTPDSKQIIFTSDRNGQYSIFRQGVDEASPELFVGGENQLIIPRLSPDQTQLLYLAYDKRGGDSDIVGLMRVPLSGGAPEVVLRADGITNHQCARLPSNVCLYSRSNPREMEFVQYDSNTGKQKTFMKIQEPAPYLYNWTLSPDGRTLAVAKRLEVPTPAAIRMISLDGSPERTVSVDGWFGIESMDWAVDGKSLWVTASTRGTNTSALLNVDLQGKAKPYYETLSSTFLGWAIQSPDGKSVALWQARGGGNVWLLENF